MVLHSKVTNAASNKGEKKFGDSFNAKAVEILREDGTREKWKLIGTNSMLRPSSVRMLIVLIFGICKSFMSTTESRSKLSKKTKS